MKTSSLAHQYKGKPDNSKRGFTAEPLGDILEELWDTVVSKRWVNSVESRSEDGTHDLADNLASGLNPTPCGDIRARNDFGTRGSHFVNESLVGDDASIEVDFYRRGPVSTCVPWSSRAALVKSNLVRYSRDVLR